MRALLEILGMLLEAEDSRWAAFGLRKPAADRAPGQPQNVVATPVPLATRYRFRIKVPWGGCRLPAGGEFAAPGGED